MAYLNNNNSKSGMAGKVGTMKAKIYVDAKTAVAAGLNNVGEYVIDFDPAELAEAHRAELATCELDKKFKNNKIAMIFSFLLFVSQR